MSVRLLASLALASLVAVALGGGLVALGGLPPAPWNPLPGGTSRFYTIAGEYGDVATVEGPLELAGLARGYDSVLLVIVSPDEPYTLWELEALRSLASKVSLSLLVMDEGLASRSVTGPLLGVIVDGDPLVERAPVDLGEWSSVQRLSCQGLPWGLADVASYIAEAPRGAEPLCWLEPLNGGVLLEEGGRAPTSTLAAVLVESGGVRTVVVSDGSVCINYYLDPPSFVPGSNEPLCRWLLELLAGPGETLIAFDVGHYSEPPLAASAAGAAGLLLGAPVGLLEALWGKGLLVGSALTLAAALLAGLALLEPPARPRRPVSRGASRRESLLERIGGG